ncbi:MAG: hypothetical protein IPJ13_14530 [Saprospiraceae bacterium]|nr:hypothetical protein [Saprospiraceae bacterium]
MVEVIVLNDKKYDFYYSDAFINIILVCFVANQSVNCVYYRHLNGNSGSNDEILNIFRSFQWKCFCFSTKKKEWRHRENEQYYHATVHLLFSLLNVFD